MENQTHFFFALRIPDETKLIMKEHFQKFKHYLPFARWVHHEDLHITLAFLGFAPLEKLQYAKKNVSESLFNAASFQIKIDHLGTFGIKQSPRIFWAGTQECKELQTTREKVFSACEKAGFQLEKRPFRPHITIARKWMGEEPFYDDMLQIWEELQPKPLVFDALDVVLYQTHLQKIPKYEVKTVIPLI